MPKKANRVSRYRLIKLFVPAFFAFYLVMIPLHAVLETEHSEVFPFFDWKLFAEVPDWTTTEFALVVDAIDGEPTEGSYYLIPSSDIRNWKVARSIGRVCRRGDPCDDMVADVLVPIVKQALGDRSVDFSIINAEVDLRVVRDGIDELANGTATRTDFFRPTEIIGQWNTETGRIGQAADGG